MAGSGSTHLKYLSIALTEACRSPPKPTNFRVGCVIVSNPTSSSPSVLSTGYTLELPGNTHAEQCALDKLAASGSVDEASLSTFLTPNLNATLYTTLEPCGKRLSGNTPCVRRIIATREGNPDGGIRKVVFGAKEPGTFVQDSQSCRLLTEADIAWEYVPALEKEILAVAMEGHDQKQKNQDYRKPEQKQETKDLEASRGTNVDDISLEERKRQEAQPRNPKKRMMEVASGA
jgi:pyrimidine deaminase RibD-like protein